MPTALWVYTELAVKEPDTGSIFHTTAHESYTCRDEWLADLSDEIRTELHDQPLYRPYDDVDMQLLLQRRMPNMHATCKVSVQLLSTTTRSEAQQLASEIAARYACCNPVSRYTLDTEYNEFAHESVDVMTFLGNEWSVAAAWWFMLIERLRGNACDRGVLAILQDSTAGNECHWFEPNDKYEHIALWMRGLCDEPNPLDWLAYRCGPLGTSEQIHEVNADDDDDELEDEA